MVEVLTKVLVVSVWIVTAGSVDVLVLTVEKIVENSVAVSPLRDKVAMEVPLRSTRIVDVDAGSVVDFETIFVVCIVDVKV